MKKLCTSPRRFALSVCLLSGLALLASDHRASAQQGKYITQAAERLTKLVDKANKDGFALTDNNFSIGGGWLKKDQTKWVALYTLKLNEGTKYRFLAAGDGDAKDVDLQVKNDKGAVVAEDTKTDPEATVDFTAPTTGLYTVYIRLYDSNNNDPCVCLAIVTTKLKK